MIHASGAPSLSQQLAANFTGTEGTYSEPSNVTPHKSLVMPQNRSNTPSLHGSQSGALVSGEGNREVTAQNESVAVHSEITFTNEMEDGASLSGYSAGRADSIVENLNTIYYTRLIRFYERYNPEKIPRAEEFLNAYKGDEEQLFKVLCQKYGPEPDLPKYIDNSTANGPQDSPNSFHFMGAHVQPFPDKVLPVEGRTEVATPYWPLCKAVTDRDVLDLFVKQKTENTELRKCYIGFLSAHPLHAWNGMTYLSSCPLPQDASKPFLGHIWSGTLANNKTLLYKTDFFRRTVLHCTDECQRAPLPPPTVSGKRNSDLAQNEQPPKSGRGSGSTSPTSSLKQSTEDNNKESTCPGCVDCMPVTNSCTGHRRWRLVIYHTDTAPFALFRVMFDPAIASPPIAGDEPHWKETPPPTQVPNSNSSQVPQQSDQTPKKNNFFTFSFSRKAKQDAKNSDSGQRIPEIRSNQVRSTRQDARNEQLLGGGSDRSSSTAEDGPIAPRRGVSPAQRAAMYRQPTQPMPGPSQSPSTSVPPGYADATSPQSLFITLLQTTEERIMRRLDGFEERLGRLESMVGSMNLEDKKR